MLEQARKWKGAVMVRDWVALHHILRLPVESHFGTSLRDDAVRLKYLLDVFSLAAVFGENLIL